MAEEYNQPLGDPCDFYGHLYDHFLEKKSESILSPEASTSSTASIQSSSRQGRSMLVTGFGMRNLASLQRALLDDEQRRQMLLARHRKEEEEFECLSIDTSTSLKSITKSTSTELSTKEYRFKKDSPLRYLMGLQQEGEEEGGEEPELEGLVGLAKAKELEGEVEEEGKTTEAMKKARKYLRQHKIFEFFRFIIAHMLSEMPENPIQFILDLLDKCLLYRTGFGKPPLLFEKPHLEQLFYLMDRMRTGFIDKQQYETGMKTLGICSFDKNPPLTTDGLVSKEFFIEEAYDCLTDLFVDMVRQHGVVAPGTPSSAKTPPPTAVDLLEPSVTMGA